MSLRVAWTILGHVTFLGGIKRVIWRGVDRCCFWGAGWAMVAAVSVDRELAIYLISVLGLWI